MTNEKGTNINIKFNIFRMNQSQVNQVQCLVKSFSKYLFFVQFYYNIEFCWQLPESKISKKVPVSILITNSLQTKTQKKILPSLITKLRVNWLKLTYG